MPPAADCRWQCGQVRIGGIEERLHGDDLVGVAEISEQACRNHDVDQRTGQGHPQFLVRLRVLLEPGHAADGKHHDLHRAHTVTAAHHRMAEFVQQHRGKQSDDVEHIHHAGLLPSQPHYGEENNQQDKCKVEPDRHSQQPDTPDRARNRAVVRAVSVSRGHSLPPHPT